MNEFKVLELFAGYGSQSLALKELGLNFKSDIAEIDKYAIDTYNQIHGETFNYGDISKINENELPDYDLITYSSPCQDFSTAGKQAGGEKGSGTRSSLLWECERIIAKVKPKYLLMENVKGLVNKKFLPSFEKWLGTLDEMGYKNYWQVLNAKDYGIPQNRERVFVVSIRKDIEQEYTFPSKIPLHIKLKDLLEHQVDEKFYLNDEKVASFIKKLNIEPVQADSFITKKYNDFVNKNGYIPEMFNPYNKMEITDIAPTQTSNCGNDCSSAAVLIQVDPKSNTDSAKILQVGNIVETGNFDNPQRGRIYSAEGLSPSLNTVGGGGLEPKIITYNIPQTVKVRKHDVDLNEFKQFLKNNKNQTNKYIAEQLNIPQTKVEHWFRNDNCFAIPDAENWFKLKEILNITDDCYDAFVTEFIEREGTFESSERVYDTNGLSPTLTTVQEPKIIIGSTQKNAYIGDGSESPCLTSAMGQGGGHVPMIGFDEVINPLKGKTENGWHFEQQVYDSEGITRTVKAGGGSGNIPKVIEQTRIRKLTPRECWRLMGVSDIDFDKISGISNSQLYKMAGNSIVTNVLVNIFRNLFKGELDEKNN